MSKRGTDTEVRPITSEASVDFVQVFEQHRARVLATCRRVPGCPEEAREMAQDIWLDRIKANHVMNQRSPMQRRRMIFAVEGDSLDSLAGVLGIGLSAVKMRINRARRPNCRHEDQCRPDCRRSVPPIS